MPDADLAAAQIVLGLALQDDRAEHGRDAWEAFAAHASEHYASALRQLQRQAEEIARLKNSRDAYICAGLELAGEIARLRAALAPFARLRPNDIPALSDLERAAQALAPPPKEEVPHGQ